MTTRRKLTLSISGLLLALIILPLILPISPLEGVSPPRELADPDSRFIEVNGLEVHYKLYGSGEPVAILLHGFGASTYSWREVFEPLSQNATVIAYDRPAFGLTARPMPGDWQGQSPYGLNAQVDLLFGLMDALEIERAILIAHSAGAPIASAAALEQPERVAALIGVGPAVYISENPFLNLLRPILGSPQMRRIGPLFARSIAGPAGERILDMGWHAPERVTPELREAYRLPLKVEHWDRALWEFSIASGSGNLTERLPEINTPALIITGDDDRIVPVEQSQRLAAELPGAELAILPNCGHLPQEECPAAFLSAVFNFLPALSP